MKISSNVLSSLLVSLWPGMAVALIPITISHQGPVYWALPLFVAKEEGYFTEQDLEVTFVVYPSGAPQVAAAVENAAWDLGAAGIVPNIIGGLQGIDTIGISNDESATNALVANAVGVAQWPPSLIDAAPIAVTPNSTGQYAVEACLFEEGFDPQDASFVFTQQSGVLQALTDGTTEYGGLWAPNLYLFLENNSGSEVICSGATADATVPGGIMIRREFIQTEGGNATTSKALAAWMRGIEFVKSPANRDQVLAYMEAFYGSFNVSISMAAMEQEINQRPLFGLDQQLDLMKRVDGAPSIVDTWFDGVAQFLLDNGVLSALPVTAEYVTDAYMVSLSEDPILRGFATFEEVVTVPPTEPPTSPPTSSSRADMCELVVFYGVSAVLGVALASM